MLLLRAMELCRKKFKISIVHWKYLVDKSSTAKFCVESMSKNLTEALLVMIIAMPTGIIDTPNIKNNIQCIKDLYRSSRNGGKHMSTVAGGSPIIALIYQQQTLCNEQMDCLPCVRRQFNSVLNQSTHLAYIDRLNLCPR